MAKKKNTKRLFTGNEYISLSNISARDAGIHSAGVMHMGMHGCVDFEGKEDYPLVRPLVVVGDKNLFEDASETDYLSYWVPQIKAETASISASYTIVCPVERRGFVCVLSIKNKSKKSVSLKCGWDGCWSGCRHTAGASRVMTGTKHICKSQWAESSIVFEYRAHVPLLSLAMLFGEGGPVDFSDREIECSEKEDSKSDNDVCYELAKEVKLAPGEQTVVPLFIGMGLEEVSAVASANELRLQGWDRILTSVTTWLDSHAITCEDEHLRKVLNINSFYCFFNSQAITIDTEQYVVTSSRSAKSPRCALYSERDALRWSLPAVLQISWEHARKMLNYALTTQLNNVGTHSTFIDGIAMQPGVQLDNICAPIRALIIYVRHTGDKSVLFERTIQSGVNHIQQILAAQKHPSEPLFETLIRPSGRPSKNAFDCFCNVYAWRILNDLSWMYDSIRDLDRSIEADNLAKQVHAAIMKHFVVDGPYGRMFARSSDLQGNTVLGDDEEGSLQLLSFYEFCSPEDELYENTVKWVHSEHNPHEQQVDRPDKGAGSAVSISALGNDLITGRSQAALEFLRRTELDDGIASDWVDGETGEYVRGRDSAACAGYLAYGIRLALGARTPKTAIAVHPAKKTPSEQLYHPPPEDSFDTKRARL